jgi:hypothetical protein
MVAQCNFERLNAEAKGWGEDVAKHLEYLVIPPIGQDFFVDCG